MQDPRQTVAIDAACVCINVDSIQLNDLRDRMAATWPEAYRNLDESLLGTALQQIGIPVRNGVILYDELVVVFEAA